MKTCRCWSGCGEVVFDFGSWAVSCRTVRVGVEERGFERSCDERREFS